MSPHGSMSMGGRGPRPQIQEDTIRSEKIQVERKTFLLILKENVRGRFLRITEDVGGRRDSIIVPTSGLEDFRNAVDAMLKASQELPPKTDAPQEQPQD